MQIRTFMNSAAGMKSKKRFVSPIKDRNEYYLLDISSIFAYRVHSVHVLNFLEMQKYVTFINSFLFYVTKYKSRTFYRIPTRYAHP